jgi:hypothetical protein
VVLLVRHGVSKQKDLEHVGISVRIICVFVVGSNIKKLVRI